jgi:hypothetical protein
MLPANGARIARIAECFKREASGSPGLHPGWAARMSDEQKERELLAELQRLRSESKRLVQEHELLAREFERIQRELESIRKHREPKAS